jgi:hypothetical protein
LLEVMSDIALPCCVHRRKDAPVIGKAANGKCRS